jgi:hypothetical protein
MRSKHPAVALRNQGQERGRQVRAIHVDGGERRAIAETHPHPEVPHLAYRRLDARRLRKPCPDGDLSGLAFHDGVPKLRERDLGKALLGAGIVGEHLRHVQLDPLLLCLERDHPLPRIVLAARENVLTYPEVVLVRIADQRARLGPDPDEPPLGVADLGRPARGIEAANDPVEPLVGHAGSLALDRAFAT